MLPNSACIAHTMTNTVGSSPTNRRPHHISVMRAFLPSSSMISESVGFLESVKAKMPFKMGDAQSAHSPFCR